MTADETRTPPEADASTDTLESLATFTLLYESRDGKLCLFEDEEGHISAVPAARLA